MTIRQRDLATALADAGLTFAPDDAGDLERQLRRVLAAKSEIRNPKSETNPNPQISMTETSKSSGSVFGPSDLGFVSDFEIRISDFTLLEEFP